MKNKIGNKIGKIVVGLMLFISIVSVFGNPVSAGANSYFGVIPSSSYVEVGDSFNTTIYINPGTPDRVDSWAIYNFTFNNTLGCVNMVGIDSGEYNLSSWIPGFWTSGGFSSPFTIVDNTTGIAYSTGGAGANAFVGGVPSGTDLNYTAIIVNFTAVKPGTVLFNLSTYDVYYGVNPVTLTTLNGTITIYPQDPATLTATTYNYSIINITYTKGVGDDNVTLCGKAGGYPTGPSDSVLQNDTNIFYNHTLLNNCTTYYYRAWGWNKTAQMHSIQYKSASATTACYSNFSFAGNVPINGSITANCTYSIPVNVTIINARGNSFRYWINASNGQTASGTGVAANTSIGRTLTGLLHNTTYFWNVTVSQTSNPTDSETSCYRFKTGLGGGTAPTVSGYQIPVNGQTNVGITVGTFAVNVTDVDSDPVNTTYYWSNNTVIGYNDYTATGGTASLATIQNLNFSTTYYWYVRVKDTVGCLAIGTKYPTSGYYSFTTQTSAITLTKQWSVLAVNNTVRAYINLTNAGQTNLTDVTVNDTSYGAYLTIAGSNRTMLGATTNWSVPWLNTSGYENNFYSIVVWFTLSGVVPNGTTFTNSVKANTSSITTTASSNTLRYSFFMTKTSNRTAVYWNDSWVRFWVNITNTGDFYMNGTKMNETYSDNLTYGGSNVVPDFWTNRTFNITQIASGATSSITIFMNKTAADWINGTTIYNNVTARANETSTTTTGTTYLSVGARTTQIRVTYEITFTDVGSIGSTVLNILGVVLIIGAILLIVTVVRTKGGFGGGE